MSKFKVGDKIRNARRNYGTWTVRNILDKTYDVVDQDGDAGIIFIGEEKWYELVESGDSIADAIDEAVAKVEIRKEMNIKEFFKPVAHKNVWAIKQPKERVK